MAEEGPIRRGAVSWRAEALLYALAAGIYITAGFTVDKGVFAWWPYSTAWFITFIWIAPAVFRTVRERMARWYRPRGGEPG